MVQKGKQPTLGRILSAILLALSPLVLIETGHAQSGGGTGGQGCLQSIHKMCCAGKNETANNSCAFNDATKSGRCTAGACADGGGASKPGGGAGQPSGGPSGSGNSGMACTNVFTFLCCDGKESSASNSCELNDAKKRGCTVRWKEESCGGGGGTTQPSGGSGSGTSQPLGGGSSGGFDPGRACTQVFNYLCCDGKES